MATCCSTVSSCIDTLLIWKLIKFMYDMDYHLARIDRIKIKFWVRLGLKYCTLKDTVVVEKKNL